MYVKEGIAYPDNNAELLEVLDVKPLDGYTLFILFSDGEAKTFDFSPLLDRPAFQPLKDEAVFRSVYVEDGIVMWCDGEIDIAPETLYEQGTAVSETAIA